jgi:hypothetical protein
MTTTPIIEGPSLETEFRGHETNNSRGWNEVFCDIMNFDLASVGTGSRLGDLLAYDPEQAFLPCVEDAGSRITGCGDIADH